MASVKDSFGDFSWTSQTPSASSTPDQVSGEAQSKLHGTRTITLGNFEHAIDEVPPSSAAGGHSELLRWHDQFSRKSTLNKCTTSSSTSDAKQPQINGHPETRTRSSANNERRYNWKQQA